MIYCNKCPIEYYCKNHNGVNPDFKNMTSGDIEKYRLCPLIDVIKSNRARIARSINRQFKYDDHKNEVQERRFR